MYRTPELSSRFLTAFAWCDFIFIHYENRISVQMRQQISFQMHNGVIARALVLDKLVSTYLAQHPGAVVNITCRASPCFLHIFYNAANPIFSE